MKFITVESHAKHEGQFVCGAVQCEGLGWPFQMTNTENSTFKPVLSCGVVSLLHKSKLEARSGLSPLCGQCVCLYYLQPLCGGICLLFFFP